MTIKKRIKKIVLIAFIPVFLSACSFLESGSGFSENEEYLEHFTNNESLGIIIDGDYYLLPESLNSFVENGWQPSEETLEEHYITDFNNLILPSQTYMEFEFIKGDMVIDIKVINNDEAESVHILDTTVVELSVYENEKDRVVIIGGITGNTSKKDSLRKVQDLNLNFSEDSRSLWISDEAHHEGSLTIYFDPNKKVVTSFTLELEGDYGYYMYTKHMNSLAEENFFEEEKLAEELFMAEANYYEGIVEDVYGVSTTVSTSPHGEAIVAKDSNDHLFAISPTRIDDENFNIDNIQPGDTIKVWCRSEEHEVEHEDGEIIPYVSATILIINDSEKYSTFITHRE